MRTKNNVEIKYPDCDELLTVVGTYWPGDPGRFSGPPENCYPPDPAEFEIEQVLVRGADILSLLSGAQIDGLAQQCIEKCGEQVRSAWDAHLIDQADMSRD